ATRWEAIRIVILPTAARGIYGSIILAFGRALGETMALAMLVGNTSSLTWSVFSPANTLAALVANKFSETSSLPSDMQRGMWRDAAPVLLGITLLVNLAGPAILRTATIHPQGAAK